MQTIERTCHLTSHSGIPSVRGVKIVLLYIYIACVIHLVHRDPQSGSFLLLYLCTGLYIYFVKHDLHLKKHASCGLLPPLEVNIVTHRGNVNRTQTSTVI